MKLKKTSALLLAGAMSLSLMTSCGASEYKFNTKAESIKLDSGSYSAYKNQLIKFNGEETKYEDWLSYESPYDEYIPLVYADDSGNYDIDQTVAFAIRYAYENDMEYIEFPAEYGSSDILKGWEYAGLSFPDLPVATASCEMELKDNGYYMINLSDTVRKTAEKSDEVIAEAKKIVDAMPEDLKTDADKAYYLYDWVCQNVGYDEYHANNTDSKNNSSQSVYGAIVEQRAVCDGIASAVQLLFNMADIKCGKVYGYNPGGGHVWNYAVIDGETWDFDATWDIDNSYLSESDELTGSTGNMLGFYGFFGTSRSVKTRNGYSLSESCTFETPATTDAFSEKSPCLKVYDISISCDNQTGERAIYKDGKKIAGNDFKVSSLKDMMSPSTELRIIINTPQEIPSLYSAALMSDTLKADPNTSGYDITMGCIVLTQKS